MRNSGISPPAARTRWRAGNPGSRRAAPACRTGSPGTRRSASGAGIAPGTLTYVDANGAEWAYSYIRDDNLGKLLVYSLENGQFTVHNDNIGTVD